MDELGGAAAFGGGRELSLKGGSAEMPLVARVSFMTSSCSRDDSIEPGAPGLHYDLLSKRETNTTATQIELTHLGPELALEVS